MKLYKLKHIINVKDTFQTLHNVLHKQTLNNVNVSKFMSISIIYTDISFMY